MRHELAARVVGLLGPAPPAILVALSGLDTFRWGAIAAEARGEIPLAALHPDGWKLLIHGAKALNLRRGHKAGLRCPRADVIPLPT